LSEEALIEANWWLADGPTGSCEQRRGVEPRKIPQRTGELPVVVVAVVVGV